MESSERIVKTIRGEKTDRVPLWLRDEFNLSSEFDEYLPPHLYRTIGSGLEYDTFTDSWIDRDPNRAKILRHFHDNDGDIILECKIPGNLCNRFLVSPPSRICQDSIERIDGTVRIEKYSIATPKGDLRFTVKFQKDISTQWMTEEPVKTPEDLRKIMTVPYSVESIDFASYHREKKKLGNRGITMVQVDTPLVTVSGLMKFEDFLMLTISDEGLLRELCDIAYERIEKVLDICMDAGMGPLYRLNGSEQATPPMNSPEIYEKYIYNYEKRLIRKIHDRGFLAAIHCHGHVRGILPMVMEMGADLIDPVEAPPSGDIEFGEARELTKGKLGLAGNIQLRDLENESKEEIRNQVKKILDTKKSGRLILNTSASPITYVSDKCRENYLTLIDAWAEWRNY